jgi:hypothetical protein
MMGMQSVSKTQTNYWTPLRMSALWTMARSTGTMLYILANNIYFQCDDKGQRLAVLQEFIDHRKDKKLEIYFTCFLFAHD